MDTLNAKVQQLGGTNPVRERRLSIPLKSALLQAQKKKADDISKKLEVLYQKMRDGTVCAFMPCL